MEGISKRHLLIVRGLTTAPDKLRVIDLLLAACVELDPWLPIDENTPKDRKLVFLFESGNISSGYWDETYRAYQTIMDVHIESLSGKITHYKELPKD